MNILITGDRGFIGTQVRLQLNAQGCHTITGVDSLEPQVHGGEERGARAGQREVDNVYDCVIHLAAKVGVGQSMYDPADYVACNSLDTAQFLQKLAAHKPRRLVVASSMSIYGEGKVEFYTSSCQGNVHIPVPTPETQPPDLRSIYALTKYDQEQLCLIWGQANDVPVVALRFFNTYGPGQALNNPYTGALAIFATRLLNGKAPVVYEDGQQTRDFIHVDDVAGAVVHAAVTGIEPGVYNVGTGVATSIEDLAKGLAQALRVDIKPEITGRKRAGDIRHCVADATKLKRTGWKAKVWLEDGLHDYAAWLRKQPLPEDRFDQAARELQAAGLVK